MTRASDPYTGQASKMSSATPAAFCSAMSMTTTSASAFSATPRATVAPTLPAPPTTVTLRFILAPCARSRWQDAHAGSRRALLDGGPELRDRRDVRRHVTAAGGYMLLITTSANCDVFSSVAPSVILAKS